MKRHFLTFICVLICISSFAKGITKETIFISVVSEDVSEELCYTIEDMFHEQLQDLYDIRLVRDQGVFADELRKELSFHESGAVRPDQIKEYCKLLGAELLCVVVIEKQQYSSQPEFYFRAKIYEAESGRLRRTAMYPTISDNDSITTIQNIKKLQIVSARLIAGLDINKEAMSTQASTAESKLRDDEKDRQDDAKRIIRKANGEALAYSLIPGVGLMMKGHRVEGAVYMVGDIALVGGGLAFMANANKQKDIMNDYSTGIDQYKSAEKKYNSSKTAAYCCFGTAAGLYIVNLVRGYVAEPKPRARLEWAFVPSVAPSMYGEPNMSMNLALSYKF